MKELTVETKKGTRVRVFEAGDGPDLLFLHGAGGLLAENPFLDQLAERFHVYAPELPAYGESIGEELLEDMLDFTLHTWDVAYQLGLDKPNLVGHSMGGMIAAEMACISPHEVSRLVLASSAGLWIEEEPIPDMFTFMPFEFAEYLFHDPAAGAALMTGGMDFSDADALQEFYLVNARRMGMAGKILFPIPNRRLSKRLYRLEAPTLVVWGESDKLIPPVYAERWSSLIPTAEVVMVPEAGHMLPYEQPDRFAEAVSAFLLVG